MELQKEYEKEDSLKFQNDNFHEKSSCISKLWIELQSQGLPPPEIGPNIEMSGSENFNANAPNPIENCLIM